jgi:hypothetical protein
VLTKTHAIRGLTNSGAFRNDAKQYPIPIRRLHSGENIALIDYQRLAKSFSAEFNLYEDSTPAKNQIGFFPTKSRYLLKTGLLGHAWAMLQSCEAGRSVERTPSVRRLNSTEKWQKALLIK